ncbi:hypothetical protein Prum_047310 [Phytohabitans rumicis]|uniref:DUF5667 domain-containing protein n=1 Tax=Phytohabitans rumicis TaxID=1076125 RepID=A0A6V8L945_9ACTN|nr:hypothetical protein Prum_047310 [Phytohabitans rumicis]
MTTDVFYRRRAERFAQLLDEADGGRRHHVRSRSDEDLNSLVSVRDRVLAARPDVEIDSDFRTGLRAMLIAKAERDGIGATAVDAPEPDYPPEAVRPKFTGRRIRARGAVIIGVAVGAIAVSGMSAASENAMPGDALYGVKRSTERAQLALASSDVTRGQLFLDFASTRLAEAEAVRRDSAGFADVLGDMDGDTRQGVKLLNTAAVQRQDDTPLDAIDSFVTSQRKQITRMLDPISGASRDRALESLTLLDQVSQRAKALRGTLDCSGTATAGTDPLGPKPSTCWAGPGQGQSGNGRGTEPQQRDGAQPAPTRTENEGPGGPSGGNGTTPSTAAPTASTPADQPAPSPSSTDDGLLDGLGRILGDLLG